MSYFFISVLSLILIQGPNQFTSLEEPDQSEQVSILFIGNSLTYSNDLPELVSLIGKGLGVNISTYTHAKPNYGLEDHWNEGVVQEIIKDNSFDFVVFQQGPSSQEYGRMSLAQYGGQIAKAAQEQGAKPVYFMVWPAKKHDFTIDLIEANHRAAAKEHDALIAKVGVKWFSTELDMLYGPDNFHPSPEGSFLAASVIYETLFGDANLSELKYGPFRKHIAERYDFKLVIKALEDN